MKRPLQFAPVRGACRASPGSVPAAGGRIRSSWPLLVAIGLAGATTACSGGSDETADDRSAGAAQVAPTADPAAARPGASTDRAGNVGDCDLVTEDDIRQAFGGKLTPRPLKGRGPRGSGCTVLFIEEPDSEMIVQAGGRDSFELRRDSARAQSAVMIEPVGIGVEGYQIDAGQVIAIDGQDQSINVALVLIVTGREPPITREAGAVGMQSLAAKALEQL